LLERLTAFMSDTCQFGDMLARRKNGRKNGAQQTSFQKQRTAERLMNDLRAARPWWNRRDFLKSSAAVAAAGVCAMRWGLAAAADIPLEFDGSKFQLKAAEPNPVPLPATAGEAASTAALIAEARRTFTLNGKQIPPEIFRDFGDGDLADSGTIWVTVDVKAAIGSNLYFDEIRQNGTWISQKKVTAGAEQETGYTYFGATESGFLVVLAAYSGGGSGDFITLHILDIAPARAFDLGGKVYERINLTDLWRVALGDRWDGKISIAKNTIRVVTTRKGPADETGAREVMTAERRWLGARSKVRERQVRIGLAAGGGSLERTRL
jgi:hypothetical protein